MDETRDVMPLLGPPGSGKTTLARLLGARARMAVIEMGNLLESEIRRDTPLGHQIKPYKAAGRLVPSELIKQVISSEVGRVDRPIILLDGFPRSLEQIEILKQLLKKHDLGLCAAIVLSLDLQFATHRLSGRRVCSSCGATYNLHTQPPQQDGICDRCGSFLLQREDDRIEVVRKRFRSYELDTIPVIEFFRRELGSRTWEECATLFPDEVLDRVWRRLREFAPGMATERENQPR